LIELPNLDLKNPDSFPKCLPSALRRDLQKCTNAESAEFFVAVLPEPTRGPCQHLTCESWNEVNMMYHAWTYRGSDLGEDQTTEVQMSLYDTKGIRMTHQSLGTTGRGIQFEELSPRTVTLVSNSLPSNTPITPISSMDIASRLAMLSSKCFMMYQNIHSSPSPTTRLPNGPLSHIM
jgi:hypothetical protein